MSTTKLKEDQKRDEVLRRMLNTPHKKHAPLKPRPKTKEKGRKKK
jgi:hypothetical protein